MNSINKTLDILEVFLNNPENELRLSEICRISGLNKSTAKRIVSVLVTRGYVNQKEKWGKYALSTHFLTSNKQIRQSKKIKEIAEPHLARLEHMVNESIILAVRDEDQIIIVDAITSPNFLTTSIRVGSKLPLYGSSVGKIFLASMTDKNIDKYLTSTDINQYTFNTITDIEKIKSSLKSIKEEGVAVDDEEQWMGIKSVAVGIRDEENNIFACIGVVGPTLRLTGEKIKEIVPLIKKCSDSISQSFELAH